MIKILNFILLIWNGSQILDFIELDSVPRHANFKPYSDKSYTIKLRLVGHRGAFRDAWSAFKWSMSKL